jgi:hypothetical protein
MLDRLRQPPAQNDHLTTSYYFLSVLYVNMIVAALAHFVFPFMEDGTFHYVSGMYTAALPLLPAGYGLYITLREIRKRAHASRDRQRLPPVAPVKLFNKVCTRTSRLLGVQTTKWKVDRSCKGRRPRPPLRRSLW